MVVKPETLVGWHRKALQLFWRWKSRGGRPRVRGNLRALIAEMVRENPTWGQRRVASELALKLGIHISPRIIRALLARRIGTSDRRDSQRWMAFVRNHAKAMVACDLDVAVTLRFQILYLFVVVDLGTHKLLHVNTTPHPNAAWTLQQLREAIPSDHRYRWLFRDRSGIFSVDLDRSVEAFGVTVLKTLVRAPKANAFCERLIGSLRRECLDWLIPLGERHLRGLLREWAAHYNRGRPHMSLGPGIPDPVPGGAIPRKMHGHKVPSCVAIKKKAILGGLRHEYRLEQAAAYPDEVFAHYSCKRLSRHPRHTIEFDAGLDVQARGR